MNPAHALHLAAVGFLVAATVFGQVKQVTTATQPAAKTGTIKGRVVAADTGLGLDKATITLLSQEGGDDGEARVVRTNENGEYGVSALKPGRYSLFVSRSGYLRQFYGQKVPSTRPERAGSTLLHVREGEAWSDIDFRLIRYGAINGRVIDASGEPLVRAWVQLDRYRNLEGRRRPVSVSRSQTDDRGHFRLFEIPPGAYYLVARRDSVLAAEGERTATPPTYYPGVLDPQEAARIEVGPGSEIQGIEIGMLEVRGFNVSGQVVFPQETQNREIYLLARRYGADGSLGGFYENGNVERTGRFTFRNIVPGKYLVTARTENFGSSEPNFQGLSGTREVEVTDSDLDGLTIPVGYGGEIHGRIEWPGDSSTIDFRSVYVRASPEGVYERFSAEGGGLTPGLKFNLKRLSEGRIRLRVELPPGPLYLKSIRIEGKEVVDQPLEIHNNEVLQAVFTVAADGAELVGMAKNRDSDAPAKGVEIVAVAAQKELRSSQRFRHRTQTDQNGHFRLRGLAPGSYLVAAIADLEPGGENDLEFLKGLEKTANRVELSPGQVLNERLKVIPVAPSQ